MAHIKISITSLWTSTSTLSRRTTSMVLHIVLHTVLLCLLCLAGLVTGPKMHGNREVVKACNVFNNSGSELIVLAGNQETLLKQGNMTICKFTITRSTSRQQQEHTTAKIPNMLFLDFTTSACRSWCRSSQIRGCVSQGRGGGGRRNCQSDHEIKLHIEMKICYPYSKL